MPMLSRASTCVGSLPERLFYSCHLTQSCLHLEALRNRATVVHFLLKTALEWKGRFEKTSTHILPHLRQNPSGLGSIHEYIHDEIRGTDAA